MDARIDGGLETRNNVFVRYTLQDKDASGVVQYFGFLISDKQWLILQIDTTTSVQPFRYANVSSNATRTTYATAWTNRATLTYGLLSALTGT